MKSRIALTVALAVASLLLGLPAHSTRASLVVPTSAATVEGGNSGSFGSNAHLVAQELYRPADMVGLNVGDVITGMRLRLNGGLAAFPASSVTFPRFDVALGVGQNSLGATFASNFIGAPTQVRSGALTMTANFLPGTGAPRDWSALITFTTPYTYTGGNLLFELRDISPAGTGLVIDAMSGAQTTGQSIFNTSNASALTANTIAFAVNWAINFEIAPVPEANAYLLMGSVATIAGIGYAAKRRKQRATPETAPTTEDAADPATSVI